MTLYEIFSISRGGACWICQLSVSENGALRVIEPRQCVIHSLLNDGYNLNHSEAGDVHVFFDEKDCRKAFKSLVSKSDKIRFEINSKFNAKVAALNTSRLEYLQKITDLER